MDQVSLVLIWVGDICQIVEKSQSIKKVLFDKSSVQRS